MNIGRSTLDRALASALAVLVAALWAVGSSAQDGSDTPSRPTAPSPETAPPRQPTPTDAGADEDEIFVPTEEIPADQEITFPVDI